MEEDEKSYQRGASERALQRRHKVKFADRREPRTQKTSSPRTVKPSTSRGVRANQLMRPCKARFYRLFVSATSCGFSVILCYVLHVQKATARLTRVRSPLSAGTMSHIHAPNQSRPKP
jgi:hypothetical protein